MAGKRKPSKPAKAPKKPTFSEAALLVRYIEPDHRLKGYPNPAAFHADPGPPRERFLSVNSAEIEKVGEIANRYCKKWGDPIVTVSTFKVVESNQAANGAGVPVTRHAELTWAFEDGASSSRAYEHYFDPANPSHSGIEFIRAMDEHKEAQFARRMIKRRYHEFDMAPKRAKRR